MNKPTNRLANETSPYLLQHAANPVDWHPWGDEALAKAKAEDKPIFLSIGYSACHWCHVMERESFEDPATAELMNKHFVNIKVDREERPDLDQIYMNAVQLMTQHGGWPMSVWLTPDLKPFFGGTYFPPAPRFNMPSFKHILERVAETWKQRRGDVDNSAEQIVEYLHRMGRVEPHEGELSLELIKLAGQAIEQVFDPRWGGVGSAPKFPHSVELRVALRASRLTGREELEHLATFSLEKMIRGGIYDQLGGGFHRYSTDARWLVPHFEKMLYDNALIPLACLEAYQATGDDLFRNAVVETLDYILREMTAPEGGFYSAQDADSEGVEGKFFVWEKREILDALGDQLGGIFCHCYDVTDQGNWEGKNILNMPLRMDECADELQIPEEQLKSRLADARRKLYDIRAERIWPGRDDKVLTSWNAMALGVFAVASQVLDEPRYRDAAVNAADFILQTMRQADGRLLRTCKDGRAHLNAYLEDYAYLADALTSLYEATFDSRWIVAAGEIVDVMIDQFWDDVEGGFFYTGKDHEELITRGKDPHDGAIPNGNAMAATAMARLCKLTGNDRWRELTDRTLEAFRPVMIRSASASAQMLIALSFHLGDTVEIALAGDPEDPTVREMLRTIHGVYLPNKVVALRRPDDDAAERTVALLAGKQTVQGGAAAYVCKNFACQSPVTDAESLRRLLGGSS